MTNITPEFKAVVLKRYYQGDEAVKAIAKDCGISRQSLYNWTKGQCRDSKPTKVSILPSNKDLWRARNHNEFTKRINAILQASKVNATAPLHEKLQEMERLYREDRKAYPVRSLCAALNVSRGAFYGYTRTGKRGMRWYELHIQEIEDAVIMVFNESEQRFGSCKITAVLRERGHHTCRATVKRIMKRLGLRSIREGAKRQWRLEHRNPQDLVKRQFNPKSPNTVWISDVSEFEYKQTKFYICVILDLFSRRVIAYKIGLRNSTHLIIMTFREAWQSRKPKSGLIFHSDRGSNYRAYAISRLLKECGATASFSHAHTPYDNSVNEAFFKNLKTEELYRRRYRSVREFKNAIARYIEFYNEKRPHQAIGLRTPAKIEAKYFK